MNILLLLSRLTISAVFAVAGLAKLADRAGSRQAARDFGVPAKLATPLGTLLPLAELAIAIALLPDASAWWGALGALVLLLWFVVGISVNLARGRQPDCHCFGQLHSAPVSWKTLLRNGLLALLAAFVIWQGRDNPGAFDWMGTLTTAEIIALAVAVIAIVTAAIEGWFLLHVLRQQGRLLLRIEALETKGGTSSHASHRERPPTGLPVGTPAPTFQLPDLDGVTRAFESLRPNGKPLVLIFSDPGCGSCSELMPDVAFWQEEYAAELTIAIISRGMPEVNRAKCEEHGLTHVLLQQDREVSQAYQLQGTPGAVYIRSDGAIGSPLAIGVEEIQELVEVLLGELVID